MDYFKGKTMKKLLLALIISLTTFIHAENGQTFTLTTTADKNITVTDTKEGLDFKEFKGKAVLLALFGHRCPPCLKEIPEFIELTNKHKDDLEIIAIEAQLYPTDKVKEFVTDHNMNYNVIAGVDHGDFVSYIAERAGYTRGLPLPLLIAVNKNGEVENVQAGLIREDELEILVKDLND